MSHQVIMNALSVAIEEAEKEFGDVLPADELTLLREARTEVDAYIATSDASHLQRCSAIMENLSEALKKRT